MKAALDQNLALLQQGVDLLREIDDAVYCVSAAFSAARSEGAENRVGPHLRHCIDAYRCLLDGLAGGVVDYDARSRDALVEADRQAGLAALNELIEELRRLEPLDAAYEVRVFVDTPAGVGADDACAWSTLYRELQFLVGHTVHHYALIAMILRQRGIEPGREFGVAPSTLQHWQHEESVRA